MADQDIVRTASAHWEGDIARGKGRVKTASGRVEATYSFQTRFANEPGTNPEELIGAAHAACFAMALSANLTRAGHAPDSLDTRAEVHLAKEGEGFSITRIDLSVEGRVQGMDETAFAAAATAAKETCPVSRALAAVDTTLQARLLR